MTKILSQDGEQSMAVAQDVLELVSDLALPAEELIPGLVAAIGVLVVETTDPNRALDEASDLLGAVQK